MRSSCIFLLLAGLIALAIESCDSASLGKNNYELEEIKLLRELVESYKRGHAVREEGDGDNVPEGGDDQGQGDGTDEGTENTEDEAEEGGDDQGQGDGTDEGTENTEDEAEDEDSGPEEGDEDDQTTGDEADLNPNEDNDDEGNENNAASDGADEGTQETPNENDDEEEGETPTDQDSESSPGPAEEESNGREREGLRKDFEEFLAQSENEVIEKLSDILEALDATKLEEAMTKVDKLLDAIEAMSADLNTYANFLETVNKHLRDGKNSLDDIANAINAAISKISIDEDITPPDNEESERQAKGEVGVPVARVVGGGPVEVGVPVARVVGGGPVEVGEPVARAVGDGPIDKRAQFLREIQLLNLIQKLKNVAKK